MRGAVDETNIVWPGQQNSGGLGAGNPPALAHRDDALRQLRTDRALLSARGSRLRGSCRGAGLWSAVPQIAQRSGSSSNAAAALSVGTPQAASHRPGVGART